MPKDGTMTDTRSMATYFPGVSASADWLKPFTEAPAKFYAGFWKEALGLTARQLQTQTDYVKTLAACDTPLGLLSCNGDFVQKTLMNWSRGVDDGLEALRRSASASTNG